METVTLLSGQTYIEEEQGGSFHLVPAHIWLEDQVATEEIALAFELLAEKRGTDRYEPFVRWLLGKLKEKYGDRWPRLFEAYLNSPYAGQLIAKIDIETILKKGE